MPVVARLKEDAWLDTLHRTPPGLDFYYVSCFYFIFGGWPCNLSTTDLSSSSLIGSGEWSEENHPKMIGSEMIVARNSD